MTAQELHLTARIRPWILDGALGTMLESQGIDTTGKSWTARSVVSDPERILRIHAEYLTAGAEIITANTFRTNSRALQGSGLDPETLTKRAVRLAQLARGSNSSRVRIAGSIAPVEDCFRPELSPTDDEAVIKEHQHMVRWLLESKVDILLIETMSTLKEAICALTAVSRETDMDVWVSLVPGDSESLLDGTPLEHAVERLFESGAGLIALNCAPVSIMMSALPRFAAAAKSAGVEFGCYPNASERRADGSWDLAASSDERIADCAGSWMQSGAMLVGSCCGTTPQTTSHILKKRNLLLPH